MKRHQQYFLVLVVLVTIYVTLWRSLHDDVYRPQILQFLGLEDNISNGDKIKFVVRALPWHGLISIGCYCLFRLGRDLLSYRDRPEEIPILAEVNAYNPCIYPILLIPLLRLLGC